LRRYNIRKVQEPETQTNELPMSEQDLNPDEVTPHVPEDTGLLPESTTSKTKIGLGELIMLTFFWTTGGPFGIERYTGPFVRSVI
jgi:hypothetical protein